MSEQSLINPCFENIIGLSRIDCGCFDENYYKTSVSTLYLDEAEGINLRTIDSIKNCDNANDLFGLMDTARNNGINRFLSDSQIELTRKYEVARSNFHGTIGEQTYKNTRQINRQYAGLRFCTANVVGGYLKINDIKTVFSANGTRSLRIYNNLNEELYAIDINTKNGLENNLQNITLPLWDERTTRLEYIFLYDVDEAIPAKDNKLWCNCGGVVYNFNTNNPYYRSGSNKLKGWSKWFMIGEIETDELDFSDLPYITDNYMNGLVLDVEMWCDLTKQFCFDNPSLNDRQFLSVAFAILHISAYYLCTQILTSPNINRYTMVNHEQLAALRQVHEDKYKETLGYLIETTDLKNTDCFVCKDNIKLRKGLIG